MNKKIKCDIYTRVSTTMQVDGYSLDAQKEKLKRYAEFQNMEIVNVVLCQEKVQVKHELFTSIICLMPHLFPFVLVLSNISFRSH